MHSVFDPKESPDRKYIYELREKIKDLELKVLNQETYIHMLQGIIDKGEKKC
jgi:hypothetical protein